MNEYTTALRKYAEFGGRATRREYWMFFLFNLIFSIAAGLGDAVLGFGDNGQGGPLSAIYGLAVLIPSLAVLVRRLHDTGRSGYWIWIGLVPLIGVVVLIVFLVQQGQRGPNRYGPDPSGLAPSSLPTEDVAAGWYADPTGRHELRYWDSKAWTENVSDAGTAAVDPMD